MRLLVELAHWRLLIDLSPQCEDDLEDEDEDAGHPARLDSHLAFGFAPDPVFPDLIWEEDEDVHTDTKARRLGTSDSLP